MWISWYRYLHASLHVYIIIWKHLYYTQIRTVLYILFYNNGSLVYIYTTTFCYSHLTIHHGNHLIPWNTGIKGLGLDVWFNQPYLSSQTFPAFLVLLFLWNRFPRVYLLCWSVPIFLVLADNTRFLSRQAVSIHFFTSSIWENTFSNISAFSLVKKKQTNLG